MDEELKIDLTDEELLARLGNSEDSFVERKSLGDSRDWIDTVVAFANSCPIGFPGVLFIGVHDDGSVQNLREPVGMDRLQMTFADKISDAWPPIYTLPRIVRKDGREILAVLVPGSELRPHFSGHAFVRVGSQTRKASESQYDALILQRNNKARAVQKMVGKLVYWQLVGGLSGGGNARLVECNQFFITLDGESYKRCWPLDWLVISYDPVNRRDHLIIQHP